MPFVRTPTNVLLRMADYTPAGFAGSVLKKIRNGASVTDREFADAFGRSATGMAVLAAGYALASKGLYQGASPSSEAERSQMYLEGRQPMSVKLGDTWYQISKLSPFAQLIGIGAAYHDASGGVSNKAFQAGLQGVKSFSELPMVSGLSSVFGAVNDPERGGKKYIEQAIGGLSPNIVRGVATGTGDVMRSRDTIADSFIAGIPGFNQTLPVRVDALGNPIPTNDVPTTLFNPFNPKEVNKDPVVQELARVGYNLNYIGDTIDNKKLIPEQERAYQKLAGAKIREYLVPVMESEEYLTSDLDTQNDIIDKVVRKAKTDARNEIRPLLDSITKGSDRGKKVSALEKEAEKERGGIKIIKRGKNIGDWDQGNEGTQVDHRTALSLGGTNKFSNQMSLTNTENQQKGVVEAHLAREVDKGNITIKEANSRVSGWKWKDEYKKLQDKKETKTEIKSETPKVTGSASITKKPTSGKGSTGLGTYTIESDKPNGKDKIIDLSEVPEKPNYTGLTDLDKKLKASYNSKITSQINQVEEVFEKGLITAEQANKLIGELTELKSTEKAKTTKAKKVKIKKIKAPKIKLPKIDTPKAPVIKTTPKPSLKFKGKKYAPSKIKGFRNTLNQSNKLV
jgi:hypothetical protein